MTISFSEQALDPRLSWYCEPVQWHTAAHDRGGLVLTTDSDTDYWQRTHYGFRRDNGHFLYAETFGDITLETRVRYEPAHDFDQAGLMVRFSSEEWIKTSVERETDGSFHLGAVVTRQGYSDWSTQAFPQGPIHLYLRIRRVEHDYHVQWAHAPATPSAVRDTGSADITWQQLRISHLDPTSPARGNPAFTHTDESTRTQGGESQDAAPLLAGVYAASPSTGGCTVRFDYLKVVKSGG